MTPSRREREGRFGLAAYLAAGRFGGRSLAENTHALDASILARYHPLLQASRAFPQLLRGHLARGQLPDPRGEPRREVRDLRLTCSIAARRHMRLGRQLVERVSRADDRKRRVRDAPGVWSRSTVRSSNTRAGARFDEHYRAANLPHAGSSVPRTRAGIPPPRRPDRFPARTHRRSGRGWVILRERFDDLLAAICEAIEAGRPRGARRPRPAPSTISP
jgi:hypothetical protein